MVNMELKARLSEIHRKREFYGSFSPAFPIHQMCKVFLRLPILKVVSAALVLVAKPANSQDIFCVPPSAPIVPADTNMQIEYRAELSQEFNDFFRTAAEYLNCLHASESQTREAISIAIEEYNRVLNLPAKPRQKVADDPDSYLLQ